MGEDSGMRRISFVAALLCLSLLSPLPGKADPSSLTVFAAASLREAFEAAAADFTKKTGIAVKFSFAGSDTLEQQISQGAPADVFASANLTQMKKAADAGLLGSEPQLFARNRLVLIEPKTNPGGVNAVADLAKAGVKVVLAAPTVPVGGYARSAFKKLNGTAGYAADFSDAVERNVVSNELDVKAVASKISLGEGDAGVVYTTDVTPLVATSTRSIAFPPESQPDAEYPIATVKATTNAPGAQAFVTFVLHEGQPYLRARGFLAP